VLPDIVFAFPHRILICDDGGSRRIKESFVELSMRLFKLLVCCVVAANHCILIEQRV